MRHGKLTERLAKGVVLGDGAMGTMLYQHGVFLNTCFDELNLSSAKLVRKVHDAYVEAGVDFIETNTFGANEFKLGRFGLAEQVEKINEAAAQIAKESAGGKVLVAGAIGPLGVAVAPGSGSPMKQAAAAFARQAKALTEAGVDFLLLETFDNADELVTAVRAVREASDLEIVAQMTANEHNETAYGQRVEQSIARIAAEDVTAAGLNCSVGPAAMLGALELIRRATDKPISVQPNAGMPRQVENRMLYMCTPEYMAEFAKRFFEKGARIIGGCCGTTPEHISQMVRAVRALDKAMAGKETKAAVIEVTTPLPGTGEDKQLAAKSRWGEKIASGAKVTSIEVTPPRGLDIEPILDKAKLCGELGVDAINIPDGPRASSRLSPLVTAVRIQQSAGLEAILHFCCRDRNLIGMQSDLLGAAAMGLRNILVITGDPPKMGDYPQATGVFDMDSIALTGVIRNLNRGIDIGGNRFSPGTSFAVGVGSNPAAAEPERELERFYQKAMAGAEYAITQPVFDAQCLFGFLDAVRKYNVPIIAGIWPFTSYKNAEFMANEVPGVVVPKGLLDRMDAAKTKEQARATGVEIAREMIEEISGRVAGFAVSAPFGNVRLALAVLGKLRIEQIGG